MDGAVPCKRKGREGRGGSLEKDSQGQPSGCPFFALAAGQPQLRMGLN